MNGLLVLNKPAGLTSRQVVNRVEEWFPGVRAGHAGTLDPLATGVLVLCLGQATRLVEYVQRMRKTYAVGIRLGAWSETDDADGVIQEIENARPPDREQVAQCLGEFIGEIEQAPPAYSAAHVEGKRAYRLARKGKTVAVPSRRVVIYRIDLVHYEYPTLALTVECGKGTYIRSLARDLGRRLGCGGYVERLERTRIGPFRIEDALGLEGNAETAASRVLPMAAALAELPRLTVSAEEARRLCQGQRVRRAPLPQGEVAIFDEAQELVGVAWLCEEALLRPLKML